MKRMVVFAAMVSLGLTAAPAAPVGASPAPAGPGSASAAQAPEVARVAYPGAIRKFKAKRGKKPGTVKFKWKASGANTDYFRFDTALTPFNPGGKKSERKGRHHRSFKVSKKKRSFVLNAKRMKKAGAPLASGQHIYVRLYAVNGTGKSKRVRSIQPMQAVAPRGLPAQGSGPSFRVAQFAARVDTADAGNPNHSWGHRAGLVADQIKKEMPGVVGFTELIPRMWSGSGSPGSLRQELNRVGLGHYTLTHSQAFADGTPGATRILYDTTQFDHVTAGACPDVDESAQCTFQLPGGEAAAYARLRQRSSGKEFWFVVVHFATNKESSGSETRVDQADAVVNWARAQRQATGIPVVVGGDLNTSQRETDGYKAHQPFREAGFYDTVAAKKVSNLKYATIHHYETPEPKAPLGFGTRLDHLLQLGMTGADKFGISLSNGGSSPGGRAYPSDHNMIYADLRLP